jgi:hypothetical protein
MIPRAIFKGMTQETRRKNRPRNATQLAKFVVDVATDEIEDVPAEEKGKRTKRVTINRERVVPELDRKGLALSFYHDIFP